MPGMETSAAQLREQLCQVAREMNRSGLNQGRAGNLSARLEDGLLISASGCHFDRVTEQDFVLVDAAGQWQGSKRPSSELAFHRSIYQQRRDIHAVVHVHSSWATTIACLQRPIPAFHYMVAVAGGHDIPCAPYADFGSEALATHAAAALRERDACLLANHGQIAVADSAPAALELAIEVESLARCYGQLLAIGEPQLLTPEQMDTALAAFAHYGRRATP